MSRLDTYASLGAMLELMAASPYHRAQPMRRYLAVEIVPALRIGQVRIWLDERGIPIGFVTFAWIGAALEAELHRTGRALADHEWSCGERLFFNDFVAPYGHARGIIRELTHDVFPAHVATSLARGPAGQVRAVKRWVGRDVRARTVRSPDETRAERSSATSCAALRGA